jgi:hypothetical protein
MIIIMQWVLLVMSVATMMVRTIIWTGSSNMMMMMMNMNHRNYYHYYRENPLQQHYPAVKVSNKLSLEHIVQNRPLLHRWFEDYSHTSLSDSVNLASAHFAIAVVAFALHLLEEIIAAVRVRCNVLRRQ